MNEISVFENKEFGQIRTVLKDGEPWFIGKDVATILGYAKPENVVSTHVDEEDKTTTLIQGTGSNYKSKTVIINESGLYSLILSSKMPKAKQFKHWVTAEVLPSIRKNGIYATDNVIDQILENPDFGISLLTKLKQEREARLEAERTNTILMHVRKTYTSTEIAKELGFKSAVELNKKLNDLRIQYKQNETWVLYSDYADLGYTEIKNGTTDNGHVYYDRRWTQRGRKFLVNLFGGSEA